MSSMTKVRDYGNLVQELAACLRERKSTWLAPLVFALLMSGSGGKKKG